VTRLFGRGQLKVALLQVAAELDGANGYSIMQTLDERVGGAWRPSPGAIYPALLALEDAGLLTGDERDGGRVYRVTPAGHRSLAEAPDAVGAAAGRARSAPEAVTTVGAVLDRVAAAAPRRQRRLDADAARRLEHRLRAGLRTTLANALTDADAGPTKETLDG
jgi:DNA-binding PadR family transcriptional regulator